MSFNIFNHNLGEQLMFKQWLKDLFTFSEPVPRYRLVPNARGSYNLERWNDSVQMYLTKEVHVTPEKADEVIANLEKPAVYYREE